MRQQLLEAGTARAAAAGPRPNDAAAIEAVQDGPAVSQDGNAGPSPSPSPPLSVSSRSPSASPSPSPSPSPSSPSLFLDADADTDAGREARAPATRLVRDAKGRLAFAPGSRLVNNLGWVVGFIELGNALDFAANVWNEVPVPVYAVVLMAVGGTVAAFLSIFAFADARLACRNVRFLRLQHRAQRAEHQRRLEANESVARTLDMDVYASVTFRELGSEVIARWFMDLLMGFGAILISIGTYMAIGGANPSVFLASNILSGYLGNTPIALYGLVNSAWATYIFCKAQGHVNATAVPLCGSRAAALVKRRSRNVQTFCAINGSASLLGGVGSMLTASRWWGYVILIPVIISSVFCNLWWRRRVGYTRASLSLSEPFPSLAPADLVADLEFAARAEVVVRENRASPLNQLVADPLSLADVLDFLHRHALFDDYCLGLVTTQPDLCDALGGNGDGLTVGARELLALDKSLHARLLDAAQACVRDLGSLHFKNRERYAAELLGTYYSIAGNVDFDGNDSMSAEAGRGEK